MSKLALYGGIPIREKPYPDWPVFDEQTEKSLLDAARSRRWWYGSGEKGRDFSRIFAEYQEAEYGLVLTNGSHTMEVALLAAGIGPGDEVIVPGHTFVATATAVLAANAVPVIVDVDPDTFLLDLDAVRQAVTTRTKAVICVHIAGLPCDMDGLNRLAADKGLLVIEDCAHAHGAEWKGRKVGALGDIGSFSFQESKTLTSGEGGALLTNNQTLYKKCRSIINCGRKEDPEKYDHVRYGSNYRMGELQAAVLLGQFSKFPAELAKRNRAGLYLNQRLAEIDGIFPQRRPAEVSSQGYYVYMFRYEPAEFNQADLRLFRQALQAEGIPTQDTYPALNTLEVFRGHNFRSRGCPLSCPYYEGEIDYRELSLPGAEMIGRTAVSIPHSLLLDEEGGLDDLVKALKKIRANAAELQSSR